MSSVAKTAATKLNWTKVISSLGLTGSTAASLTAFKKRHDEAKKDQLTLAQQPTTVDFAYYRSVLKNTKVIDEIEKAVNAYKPCLLYTSRCV